MTRKRHLTRAQLRQLERELRNERARLERTFAPDTASGDETTSWGRVLQGPPNEEGGLAVALETRTLARHETLTSALRRLEAGSYGVCLGCGGPIPFGRLTAIPEATHCLSCGARG
jgi:DnaK suppressor protein